MDEYEYLFAEGDELEIEDYEEEDDEEDDEDDLDDEEEEEAGEETALSGGFCFTSL